MTIEFEKNVRTGLIGEIRQYFQEELDQDIGDLKATLLLDFILKQIYGSGGLLKSACHAVK